MNKLTHRKGIYLLPNLFTTASLFSAFYSIVASLKHQYEVAVIAIFIGVVADSLDGRVARLTNTQTDFGAEYDSLSDMVAFGVAPAILNYSWTLTYLGKIGWLVAFIYTASVALRLARFNTQIEVVDKRYFQGLPCPAGAAVVSSFVWLSTMLHANSYLFAIPAALLMSAISLLMVSNFRYYSFKDLDFKGRVPFLYALIIVLIFVGIAIFPSLVLFLAFAIYSFSGLMLTIIKKQRIKRFRIRRKKKNQKG